MVLLMENEVPGTLAATGARTERRIAWLTLAFGGAASLGGIALHQGMWAAGLAIGAVLGWLNFRWLRRGLDTMVVQSLEQSESKKPQVPLSTYLAIALRYALIGVSVYVILVYRHV